MEVLESKVVLVQKVQRALLVPVDQLDLKDLMVPMAHPDLLDLLVTPISSTAARMAAHLTSRNWRG